MTAFATGGLAEDPVTVPDEWPDGWTFPPDGGDGDTFADEDPFPLPPGWPIPWPFDAYKKTLASTKDSIVFISTVAEPAPASANVSIPYTVNITKANDDPWVASGLNKHLLVVQAGIAGGASRGDPQVHQIAVTDLGVTAISGNAPALVYPNETITLRCKIVTIRADAAVDITLPSGTFDLSLSMSSACAGDTLNTLVTVDNDVDNLFSDPVVQSATVT